MTLIVLTTKLAWKTNVWILASQMILVAEMLNVRPHLIGQFVDAPKDGLVTHTQSVTNVGLIEVGLFDSNTNEISFR